MSGSAAEKGIHDKEKSKAAGKDGKDDGKRQYGGPVSLKVQQRHQLEVLMADPVSFYLLLLLLLLNFLL